MPSYLELLKEIRDDIDEVIRLKEKEIEDEEQMKFNFNGIQT